MRQYLTTGHHETVSDLQELTPGLLTCAPGGPVNPGEPMVEFSLSWSL